MKICTNCRFYKPGKTEDEDTCTHDKSKNGGVRAIKLYTCRAMRAGICGHEAACFHPKESEAA